MILGFGSCNQGPNVTVYISTPKKGGMNYSSQIGSGFVTYDKTDKFIAFTPTDAQTLLEYCKISQDSQSQIQNNLNLFSSQ